MDMVSTIRGMTSTSKAELRLAIRMPPLYRWYLAVAMPGPSLFRLVEFEDGACSLEIDHGSVDDHLVVAGIGRCVVHIFNDVAVGSQFPKNEVDIYHSGLEDDWLGRGCLVRV